VQSFYVGFEKFSYKFKVLAHPKKEYSIIVYSPSIVPNLNE